MGFWVGFNTPQPRAGASPRTTFSLLTKTSISFTSYAPARDARGRKLLQSRKRGRNMSTSIYERLGGDAAVDIFYRKVLSDDRISNFFDDVDMDRQRAKQKAFLTFAFGGPNAYSGKDMKSAHARMNLTEGHFNAVMENLGATLTELGVPPDLIGEAAAIALSVKSDIVSR